VINISVPENNICPRILIETYLLTYLLTPWSRVLLEKLTVNFAASQEISRIYGTRKSLTVPTSARQLSLSWTNSIQSPQPHPTFWRSILILSSHLRLGLPNGLFFSGIPTNTLCTPLSSPIRATCPAHLIRLWVPVTTAWRVLRLRMEERPPIWRVAVNKLNKQPRTANEEWSSSLGVGRGASNPSS
jgi:hypothetical protein